MKSFISLHNSGTLCYRLSPVMIRKQTFQLLTNRVEAIHQKTLRALPKNKLQKRSSKGRCLYTVLSDSLGLGKSILLTGKILGYTFNQLASEAMLRLTKRVSYHKARQRTYKFCRDRYLLKYAKLRSKSHYKYSFKQAANVPGDHASY